MRVALQALDPEWRNGTVDWGCSVECRCPVHENHRIELLFENCCGGHEVISPDIRRYHRVGTSFSTLTIVTKIHVVGCFQGWLADGVFFIADH